jgi:hypothetical protein
MFHSCRETHAEARIGASLNTTRGIALGAKNTSTHRRFFHAPRRRAQSPLVLVPRVHDVRDRSARFDQLGPEGVFETVLPKAPTRGSLAQHHHRLRVQGVDRAGDGRAKEAAGPIE